MLPVLLAVIGSYLLFIHLTHRFQLSQSPNALDKFHMAYRSIAFGALLVGFFIDFIFHSMSFSAIMAFVIILAIMILTVSYFLDHIPLNNLRARSTAFWFAVTAAHIFILTIPMTRGHHHMGMGGGYSLDLSEMFYISILLSLGSNVVAVFMYYIISFTQGKRLSSHATRKSFGFKSTPSAPEKNMKQHYLDQGMNQDDIVYFRTHMATAKEQIISIEQQFPKTAKLRAIETRHKTIATLQTYFKDIVKHPTRLTDASHFICKILPTLEDLILKYNEVQGHIAKNKQTYQILDRTAATIEVLCEEISQSYINFHDNVYKALEDELTFAQQNLQHVHPDTSPTMEEILSQDIDDDTPTDESSDQINTN